MSGRTSEVVKRRQGIVVFFQGKIFGNRLEKHLSKMTLSLLEVERWRGGCSRVPTM